MSYPNVMPEHNRMPFMQGHAPSNEIHHPQPGGPPILPPTPFTPVMNQFSPKLIGYYLKPVTYPDGQLSWDEITTQRMVESEAKLAEIVKKDPSENKPNEALQNKHLGSTRRLHIDRLVDHHIASEPDPAMTWKPVSLKLSKEKVTIKTTKEERRQIVIKSIRVILKRVSRSGSGAVRHQSISFSPTTRPAILGPSHGQQGAHQFTFESPRHATPTIHQNTGHHGGHGGALFGEQTHPAPAPPPRLPDGMTKLNPAPEVIDDRDNTYDDYEEDMKHQKPHKKDEKSKKEEKGKKDKQKAKLDIYIPNIRNHEHRSSKSSSRPTSWSGSDGFSVLDSPLTSMSGSPSIGGWEPKHASKHYKKYHSGRSGDNPRHDRRVSFGAASNDSFVVIPHQTQRSSHKYKNSTDSLDMAGLDSPRYRRESQYHDDRVLAEKLLSMEIEKKRQDRRELEHEQVMDRLSNIETMIYQGSREVAPRELSRYDRLTNPGPTLHYGGREMVPRERPLYDRSYSDNYEVGYTGGRRRSRSGYQYR